MTLGRKLLTFKVSFFHIFIIFSDSQYKEAAEGGGEAELPRALLKFHNTLDTEIYFYMYLTPPHPLWESLQHSSCVITRNALPPQGYGRWWAMEKKKKDNCLNHLKFISSRWKTEVIFFLPNCLLNFLHYALNIYFLPNLYLKVDILKYHIQLILYLGFVFSSIYSVSNCVTSITLF